MRINGGLRVQTLLALLYGSMAALNVATAPAQAAADTAEAVQSPPERKRLAKYRAPQGFNGYPWGTSLRELKGLAADPQYVQIAHSSGKVTELDWHCVENGANLCDLELTLQTTLQKIEGAGIFALAEYQLAGRGFRLNDTGRKTIMYPVYYQACAQWQGVKVHVPEDMLERMKLCGVRLYFRSETAAQLAAIEDDEYVTNYERVLRWLLDTHGDPEGYSRRGQVIIQTPNERVVAPRQRRYDEWRWCRPKGRDLSPPCEASIVFTFDAEAGRGLVMYVTRRVWEFAHARHEGGAPNDSLHQLLYGVGERRAANADCTGTLQRCRPPPPREMSAEVRELFRLPHEQGKEIN